jgi:uncharacterized damage-inducible protein DinB
MKVENILLKWRYHQWATQTVLYHMATMPKPLFSQTIQSVFPSLSATFYHMYEVDQLWFKRLNQWESEKQRETDCYSFIDAETTRSYFEKLHKKIEAYLEREEHSDRLVHYLTSEGIDQKNSLEEIIEHVVNHGTYHRGNLTAMVWQLGETSVSTDYIFYLRNN